MRWIPPCRRRLSVRLAAAGGWTALQIVTAIVAGDHRAGRVAGSVDLPLQHDHGATDAGRNRAGLARAVYAKLQRLSFSFFDVHGSNSIFNRVTGDVQNTRLFVDGVSVAGREHDPDAGGVRVFHVAHPSGADAGVPVGVAAVVVAGAILFRAAAAGLSAQPRIDGQYDFAVQRKRARHANRERLRRRSASGPPVSRRPTTRCPRSSGEFSGTCPSSRPARRCCRN